MAAIHVVIPVYNAKNYLRQTLRSVLDQPCRDIDIVLVDDGSTDGSGALCDQIAGEDPRISVIHQDNGGVSAARNAGIEYFLNKGAEGYVAFLDADDLWFPNVFDDALVESMQNTDKTDVFVFGCTTSDEQCEKFEIPRQYAEETVEGGNGVIWRVQRTFCANLYGTHLLRQYGIRFVSGLKYSEDKIFAMQCLFLARNVTFLPKLLHIYRKNNTSAMGRAASYRPVDYYTPIIDGWIASDLFLNSQQAQSGRSINAGFVLAGIYFLDMAREHFKQWRRPRDLEKVKAHPYYWLFENMKENCVSRKQYRDHKLLLEHPVLFALKYNAIGAVEAVARLGLRNRWIRGYREKKRYSLRKLPENK